MSRTYDISALQIALLALLLDLCESASGHEVYKYNLRLKQVYTGPGIIPDIQTRSVLECVSNCAIAKDCRSISWREDAVRDKITCRLQGNYPSPEELVADASGGYAGMINSQ